MHQRLFCRELNCHGLTFMRTITSWLVKLHFPLSRLAIARIINHNVSHFCRVFFGFATLVLMGLEPLCAQEGLGSTGAFMRLGVGARAGSLGDAYVGAATGPEAIHWNPAGMAVDPSLQFALTQRRYSFDRNFN